MTEKRLKNLSDFLENLGSKWKPDGGPDSIKRIWDANRKKFNLNYFAKNPYVAILIDKKGNYYYLVDLESRETYEAYAKWNNIGDSGFCIFNLDSGKSVYERIIAEVKSP